jgi:hypothetical protein
VNMYNLFQTSFRLVWVAAFLLTPCSVCAEDTQWSSFLLFETPSKQIKSKNVALKYRIAATGVRYDKRYGRALAHISAGFAYSPSERANIELAGNNLTIKGPVQASYIRLGTDVDLFSLEEVAFLATLNSELFNFTSDNLTGWIDDNKVYGSVKGKMVNNKIGVLVELPTSYRNITAKTSLEYEFWQYSLDSKGSVTMDNVKAKSSLPLNVASNDFSFGLALAVPLSNYELDLEYKTKVLSKAQNARIQRFSLVYRF